MEGSKSCGILVVMIAHNELECVKINLKILLNELQGTDSEIVVVDNGSNDGLQDYLKEQQYFSYIATDQVEGYGNVLHVIRQEFGTKRDILLLRANYFLVTGSIRAMKSVLDTKKELAAAGPVSNGMAGEQACIHADTYENAQIIKNSLTDEQPVITAYLDTDVMMIRGCTFACIDEKDEIPGIAMRNYKKAVLEKGYLFAVVKNAVCFAACGTKDEPYRKFNLELYRWEQLHQLLYLFGDISYKGVYLYKYIEPEILEGVNEHRKVFVTEEGKRVQAWTDDKIYYSTKEEAEETLNTIKNLPHKDVLFVTLSVRKFHKDLWSHTVMEGYMASLDENMYMDLEYVGTLDESICTIPTKNRYPVVYTAISNLYGTSELNKFELYEFIYNRFIYPLEVILETRFEQNHLWNCLYKASMALGTRKGFIEFYRRVFEKVKPKVIIYAHGQDMKLVFLREVAIEYGIPTLEIAHGITAYGAYHKNLSYADSLVVYSDIEAKQSLLLGNDKVFAVGKPGVYEDTKACNKTERQIVIAFISSLEAGFFDYAKNLAEKLDKQKYRIIYKYHSGETWSSRQMEEMELSIGNFTFASDRIDIRDIFLWSDIVVGIRSTGMLEALNYPTIKVIAIKDKVKFYSPDDYYAIIDELLKNDEIVMADDEEQLYQEVINYKRNIMYRKVPNQFWLAGAEERFRKLVSSYISDKKDTDLK